MSQLNSPIKLIVGLGNPGPDYVNTRHNAGQDFVEALARLQSQTLSSDSKFFGSTARVIIDSRDVRLLVPNTYMNRSGQAVAAICNFYKIDPENVLVAHDELDLAPGVAKLKLGGGHGGHNGLRDIISAFGNNKNFSRLRLGIGHPGNAKQVANYVLKRASNDDRIAIENAIDKSLKYLPEAISGNWESAMKALHTPT